MVSINGANVFLSDIEHELSLSKIENVSEVAACSFLIRHKILMILLYII